jgi:hypothetical protein
MKIITLVPLLIPNLRLIANVEYYAGHCVLHTLSSDFFVNFNVKDNQGIFSLYISNKGFSWAYIDEEHPDQGVVGYMHIRGYNLDRHVKKIVSLIQKRKPKVVVSRGEITFRSPYITNLMWEIRERLDAEGIQFIGIDRRTLKSIYQHHCKPTRVGICNFILSSLQAYTFVPVLTKNKQAQGNSKLTYIWDAIALLFVYIIFEG